MKKKVFSVLMTMVLVLSLGMVFAAPASADPGCGIGLEAVGAGTAEWSTGPPVLYSGSHSAKLYVPDGSTDMAVVSIDTNIALNQIYALSFQKYVTAYGGSGFNPGVWLFIDANNDGAIDFTLEDIMAFSVGMNDPAFWAAHGDDALVWVQDGGVLSAVDTDWVEWDAFVMPSGWGSDSSGSLTSPGNFEAVRDSSLGTIDPTDKVMKVVIMIGGSSLWLEQTTYIDDVTINGDTYHLPSLELAIDDPGEQYVCQDFEVTATIHNLGNEDANFKAIIDIGAGATWVSGGDADLSDHPQFGTAVQPSETWTVTWMLHCTEAGTTDVTVKAKCAEAPDWIEDTFVVTQVDPALAVAITFIDSQLVGENFVVTATVTSTGPNTSVVATIDLQALNAEWISGGDADQTGYPIPIGDMADGATAVVTWTLRCTAENTGTPIKVTATSAEASGDDTESVAQTTPLHPILTAYGAVTVVPDGPFHPGQTFSVDAIITNDGDEPALDCSATISFSNELVGLVFGDSEEKDLGDIQPGATHHANWTVICNGAGSTVITVTPAGDDDVTGESIAAADLRSGSETVQQIPIDGLTVAISGPVAGTQYGPTQEFHVTGTVTNTGASPITDATVSIVIGGGGNASVTGDTTVAIGSLPYSFDWTLTCTEVDVPPDYTTITVNASGTSEKTAETVTGSDDTWVYQKYLIVEITVPTTTEFCVDADIIVGFTATNYYTSTLSNVRALLTLTGPAHLVGGWPAELDLDPLVFDTPIETAAGWHINCDGPGAVTLNVYVSGIHLTTTIDNEDEITVNQYAGADLDVVSTPETCQWVGYGKTFVVSATVTNNGDATATGVTADLSLAVEDEAVGTGDGTTDVFYLDYPPIVAASETIKLNGVTKVDPGDYSIDDTTGAITFTSAPGAGVAVTADYTNNGITIVSGADPQTIGTGTLLAGGSGTATWTVRCISFCDVPITVIAAGTDVCGTVTGSNLEIVHQLPLEVMVVSQEAVETGTTFCVTAKIWNRTCLCGEVAPFDVTGVTATITFAPTSGASLVTGELATKTIGTVYRCQSQEVEWTVHCDSIGEVDITVTVQTSTTPITGDPLTYTVSTSDLITVEQIRSLIQYDVPLAKGWNYMSLPLIPEDSDIAKVLAPIALQYNNVWKYVAGEWKLYAPSVPITEFTTMTDGVGYAIRVINPAVLTGQGYELPTELYVLPPEYALQQGWNLVGFKTMDFVTAFGTITNADTMAARLYLGNLQVSGGEARIIGDEARFLRTYLPGIGWRVLTDSDLMLVGKGYWLYVSLEDLSIVPPIER